VLEGICVTGRVTVDEPGDTFESNSDINNLNVKFFARSIVEGLVLHEHHVSHFEPMHEILDGGAKVATASPHVLNVGDLIGVNLEGLGQPTMVELEALILEEFVFVGIVEHLDAQHDKARVVASSNTDVVQIVEARAELRADEGVRGRVKLTCHAVGLEAEDTSGYKINIIAPSRDHRVAIDAFAGDTS
jgi:hypothetical protein